jgi:DNA-binding response OmpR family regulator
VVVLTIRDIESEKTKALDLGASEYMVKPFDQDVLVAKIREKMKEEVGW